MISGFLTVRAVRKKAKASVLTAEKADYLVSFHEVALSRPEQRDRSTATLCSKTASSDDEEEQEQLIGKPNIYVRLDIG